MEDESSVLPLPRALLRSPQRALAVYKLAYVSRATNSLMREEVESMVDRAQQKNAEWGITGFLCLRNDMFLQYLEGEESAVNTLFETIRNDPRHEVLSVARLGHQPLRNFADWRMRFLDDYYLGQNAIEDLLEGILREFGRGTVDARRIAAMADRLVKRVAASVG